MYYISCLKFVLISPKALIKCGKIISYTNLNVLTTHPIIVKCNLIIFNKNIFCVSKLIL